jgi:hypothetical protein
VQANGCETDIHFTRTHCGGCGLACTTIPNGNPACVNGVCVLAACNSGFGDCDGDPANGCETNLLSSATNCGSCGRVCVVPNASARCFHGLCDIASCNPGFGDCNFNAVDGCETDITANVLHCGACGRQCAPRTVCESGACCYPAGQIRFSVASCCSGLTDEDGVCL